VHRPAESEDFGGEGVHGFYAQSFAREISDPSKRKTRCLTNNPLWCSRFDSACHAVDTQTSIIDDCDTTEPKHSIEGSVDTSSRLDQHGYPVARTHPSFSETYSHRINHRR